MSYASLRGFERLGGGRYGIGVVCDEIIDSADRNATERNRAASAGSEASSTCAAGSLSPSLALHLPGRPILAKRTAKFRKNDEHKVPRCPGRH